MKRFKYFVQVKIISVVTVLAVLFAVATGTLHSAGCFGQSYELTVKMEEYVNQGLSSEEAFLKAREEVYGGGNSTSQPESPVQEETPAPQPAPKCSHDWKAEVAKEATCVAEGQINYTCTKCGETKSEKVTVTEHDYRLTAETDGNCSEKATQTFTCATCGDSYVAEGEYGDHLFVKNEKSVDPTCEEAGVLCQTCSICGEETSEELDALGHDFGDPMMVTEATCTTDGLRAKVCTTCGATTEEESIPATGHTKSEQYYCSELPTFWKDGSAYYDCTVCKEVLETVELPAKGGIWRYVIVIGCGAVAVAGIITAVVLGNRKKPEKPEK